MGCGSFGSVGEGAGSLCFGNMCRILPHHLHPDLDFIFVGVCLLFVGVLLFFVEDIGMFGFTLLSVGDFCCKFDVLFVECPTKFP